VGFSTFERPNTMAQVPTGTTFFVAPASVIGAAKTVTVVTNAAEAVVTSAAHGYANGNIVLMASGWGRLHKRVFRIKSVTTDTFVLEGEDTTNTTFYPSGTGIGSVQLVGSMTQITSVMNPTSSGGEPKTVNYKFVESDVEYSINDGFSATSYAMDLDADAIGSAGYTALKTLTQVQTDTVLKMVSRSGAQIFQPCTVALNESVQLQDGQINLVKVTFNGNNKLTRYAS